MSLLRSEWVPSSGGATHRSTRGCTAEPPLAIPRRSATRPILLLRALTAGLVAWVALGAPGALQVPSASAATDLTMPVSASAVGEQVTADSTLLHDDTRGDSSATGYQIGYQGKMSMSGIWAQYGILKTVYKVLGGHSEEEWDALHLTGTWQIEFTVDPTYVSLNPSFLTVAGLQAQYERENAGTDFPQYMRVTGVNYDPATGHYVATYALQDGGANEVSAGKIDEAQPQTLTLTTPEQALWVKESDFVPGRTIVMTKPKVSGTLTVTTLFVPQLPVNFSGTGADVTLTMVPTYRSTYRYVSGTPGRTLPAAVTQQLPQPRRNLPSGTQVTPEEPGTPTVQVPAGTWTWQSWDPAQGTVGTSDLEFVGTWAFTPGPTPTLTPTPTPTPSPTTSTSPSGSPTPSVTPSSTLVPSSPPTSPSVGATSTAPTPTVAPELPDTGAPTGTGSWTLGGALTVMLGGVLLWAGRRSRRTAGRH